ncbi:MULTISPECIES: hypothetical protein [unclassified Streptomyces]|nr:MULTISPECIES: hypothetical protein [unclassified Streptomyces]WSJ21702.1 hypothetical protein OG384_06685 [Streptomyces sp. NBC_01324]
MSLADVLDPLRQLVATVPGAPAGPRERRHGRAVRPGESTEAAA